MLQNIIVFTWSSLQHETLLCLWIRKQVQFEVREENFNLSAGTEGELKAKGWPSKKQKNHRKL